jgi:cytoskeletal protein RodZ
MQFLAYIVVIAVSFSTILLELHWLTSPSPQPKPAVVASAAPPKADGPNVELSPVYPKPETPADATASAPPVATAKAEPVAPAPVAPAAPDNAAAKAEPTPTAKVETQTTKVGTTGSATPVDVAQPAVSSATFTPVSQAHAATPPAQSATAAAKNKCDVAACAAAYSSFQASDCTYQPFEGPRQLCAKPPAAGQKTASAPHGPSVEPRKRGRDEELHEVRRLTPRTADFDDDDDMIVVRRPRW